MKFFLILCLLIILESCSNKPKAVLICGDHVCVNKDEAEIYFKENLSIEVKIIKEKNDKDIDLVQLNLQNKNDKENIKVIKKKETNDKIRVLSRNEIKNIKKDIKIKSKSRIDKNLEKQKSDVNDIKEKLVKKNNNKKKIIINDICTKIQKCSIEEITKYLINEGKKKKFPDITTRQ